MNDVKKDKKSFGELFYFSISNRTIISTKGEPVDLSQLRREDAHLYTAAMINRSATLGKK